ncbi:hypothetical protein FWH30_03460 [Microgenomates group bacterium]|nr:hypothetical protein [Microgenomates group bacterium]
MNGWKKHHLLYPRTMWAANPETNRLRNHFTIDLPIETEENIHRQVEIVPVIPICEANRLWDLIGSNGGGAEERLAKAKRILEDFAREKVNEYSRELLLLTAKAIGHELRLIGEWRESKLLEKTGFHGEG